MNLIKISSFPVASLFLLIPYCYIPGAFIVFTVQEKSCKSKHLQLVSGVDVRSYWISNYAFDASVFLLLTLLVMAVFMFYGSDSAEVFVGDLESFFCTMALTFGYGLSILPFAYLCSRRFNNHSSAQIAVIVSLEVAEVGPFVHGIFNSQFCFASFRELDSSRALFSSWHISL
jgi:hypothetical protein